MYFETEIASIALGTTRCAAWAYTAPVIGDRFVPARIRGAAAVVLGFAVSVAWPPVSFGEIFARIPSEILLGLSLGFFSRCLLAGIDFGAQLIGVQLGLGFAQQYDPMLGEQSLPIRQIVTAIAGIAFLSVGGFDHAIRALSIQGPATVAHMGVIEHALMMTDKVFHGAVRLAAPMLLAGVVANVAFGLASRAAPALNAFSVMLALALVVGAFVLFGTLAPFVEDVETAAAQAAIAPLEEVAK